MNHHDASPVPMAHVTDDLLLAREMREMAEGLQGFVKAFGGSETTKEGELLARGAERLLALASGASLGGWRAIDDDAKEGRVLLVWKRAGGLGEHVELGRWDQGKGWVNTYGHPFNGDPDAWSPLAPFPSDVPQGLFGAVARAAEYLRELHADIMSKDLDGALDTETDPEWVAEELEAYLVGRPAEGSAVAGAGTSGGIRPVGHLDEAGVFRAVGPQPGTPLYGPELFGLVAALRGKVSGLESKVARLERELVEHEASGRVLVNYSHFKKRAEDLEAGLREFSSHVVRHVVQWAATTPGDDIWDRLAVLLGEPPAVNGKSRNPLAGRMMPAPLGYLVREPAGGEDFQRIPLTTADKAAGCTEKAVVSAADLNSTISILRAEIVRQDGVIARMQDVMSKMAMDWQGRKVDARNDALRHCLEELAEATTIRGRLAAAHSARKLLAGC